MEMKRREEFFFNVKQCNELHHFSSPRERCLGQRTGKRTRIETIRWRRRKRRRRSVRSRGSLKAILYIGIRW